VQVQIYANLPPPALRASWSPIPERGGRQALSVLDLINNNRGGYVRL
jgi:hypothetical protein